jgi:replicative DNA helicase
LKEQIGTGKFYINDNSRGKSTVTSIAASVEALQPDTVIIDYLTLLGGGGDDWRGVGKLSGDIQSLAQRYQIPTTALAQINRVGAGKEPPGAEHLSQADAIGQDADLVVTMAQQSKSVMKMKIAKFRHGPDGGIWYAKFTPGTGQYEEIGGDAAADLIDEDNEEE